MSWTELQSEFGDVFLDDDFFSETVNYTASGSVAKEISAIVYRNKLKNRPGRNDGSSNNREMVYDIELAISRDATEGIETITVKEDAVSLAVNIGDTATGFRVMQIIRQDPAVWYLGLSK